MRTAWERGSKAAEEEQEQCELGPVMLVEYAVPPRMAKMRAFLPVAVQDQDRQERNPVPVAFGDAFWLVTRAK